MGIKEIAMRPFELLAGRDYPDVHEVRHQVSEPGVALWEVDLSVSQARSEFVEDLIHLNGLKTAIIRIRSK